MVEKWIDHAYVRLEDNNRNCSKICYWLEELRGKRICTFHQQITKAYTTLRIGKNGPLALNKCREAEGGII